MFLFEITVVWSTFHLYSWPPDLCNARRLGRGPLLYFLRCSRMTSNSIPISHYYLTINFMQIGIRTNVKWHTWVSKQYIIKIIWHEKSFSLLRDLAFLHVSDATFGRVRFRSGQMWMTHAIRSFIEDCVPLIIKRDDSYCLLISVYLLARDSMICERYD